MKRNSLVRLRISICVSCALALLAGAMSAYGQTAPEAGAQELQIWTGGGHGVNGSTQHTGVWNLGLRWGLVLSNPHGPGFLRGRLEYAVDAVPVFWVFQRGKIAYGAGIDPFAFKWMLTPHGRLAPYLELGGGTLFTNVQAPPGTSRANFTTSGALGMEILGKKWTWSVEARFMHISNAGISAANPGINTMQLRLGLGTFRR